MQRGSSWYHVRRHFPGLALGIMALVASTAAGLGWMQPRLPTLGVEGMKLAASNPSANDRFGSSLAIDGGTAVVGAPRVDHHGNDSGLAYVFRQDGSGWVEAARLAASEGSASDRFGTSVALDGDTLLVGAGALDDEAGSAYVFYDEGHGWVEEARLAASDGVPRDRFGTSVALDGDAAVVGAPEKDGMGAAYVFRYSHGGWLEEARLVASDRAPGDRFGDAVAVSGDTVVVGAWHDEPGGSAFSTGSAYVFRHDGAGWVEGSRLTASDGRGGDAFGRSVAVANDTILVGTPRGEDESGIETGAVYAFHYDGREWLEEAKLVASDGTRGGFFGISVAIAGDTTVVGADAAESGGKQQRNRAGSAYVFRYDGRAWVEILGLTAGDGILDDRFGSAVAIGAGSAAVGAPLADGDASNAGSAYVFAVPEPDATAGVAAVLSTLAGITRMRRRSRPDPPARPGAGPTTDAAWCVRTGGGRPRRWPAAAAGWARARSPRSP